jgi:tetrahydromethanopterin S-methyltransferase subunit G
VKNNTLLFLWLFIGCVSNAQVVSDRIGFINSTEVVPNSSFQIEGGYVQDNLDYSSTMVTNASQFMFRQSASDIHEFRIGYVHEPKIAEDIHNLSFLSLGVKLKVANYEKLKIASIATWGFDVRTLMDDRGPLYYLQLEVPAEYFITDRLSIQSELRFNHLFEQTDITIAVKKQIGSSISILPGMVNQFLLSKRGDNGERPEWAELSYASIAVQGVIGSNLGLDIGALYPILTGKDQYEPSGGIVIKGGITFLIKHEPWLKNKRNITEEIY